MSNTLKVVFGSVITLLIGLIFYLGWMYYSETKGTTNLPTQKPYSRPLPAGVEKSKGQTYKGFVFCMRDVEKGSPLTNCENLGIVIKNNEEAKVYELVENGTNARLFNEKDEVMVTGVIRPGVSPLGPPDGTIYVFEISKP